MPATSSDSLLEHAVWDGAEISRPTESSWLLAEKPGLLGALALATWERSDLRDWWAFALGLGA
jgi:hypothetical protein